LNISIFGLGYVGTVSAACFAKEGHLVVGVDPAQAKVDLINKGLPPIIEKDVGEMIAAAAAQTRLRATTDARDAVLNSEVSLICVGTPSQLNGSLDLRYVRRVCEEIGSALKEKPAFHVVVSRSTVLPGTTDEVVIPTLEESSSKRSGVDFGVCLNPEFLREGTAVHDFHNPPKTVIGATDSRSESVVATLYAHLDAPVVRTDIRTAEMVKYTDNVWHALKIGFANEIGNLCKAQGIDGHRVMDIFCADTKLNLSAYYLKPGFAFGGSCLPKDVRALTYRAKRLDVEVPILSAILPSNEKQVERGLGMILSKGHRRVGVLGYSFKAGTDDLRESPMVEIVERLLGKGYNLALYDRSVNIAALTGANRDYLLNHIPHISRLAVASVEEVLTFAQTIVIGNGSAEFRGIEERLTESQVVVDLARALDPSKMRGGYDGICW
jgi:GDP-mannose 6-dehydrogenase